MEILHLIAIAKAGTVLYCTLAFSIITRSEQNSTAQHVLFFSMTHSLSLSRLMTLIKEERC